MTSNKPLLIAASVLSVSSAVPAASVTIADTSADWVAARANGVGVGGGAVVPGSAADAPEHGHPDAAGTGEWYYLMLSGPNIRFFDSALFYWDGARETYTTGPSGFSAVGQNFQHPQGSDWTIREWRGGHDIALGDVRIQGSFWKKDTTPHPASNGVELSIQVGRPLAWGEIYRDTIAGTDGAGKAFDLTLPSLPGGHGVRFALGANGSNANFDSSGVVAQVSVDIAPVPLPPAGVLLATALGLLICPGSFRPMSPAATLRKPRSP